MIEPYYDRDGITLYNADCRDVLPHLPKFDLLLTDPPYGIGDRMQGGTWGAAAKYEKFRKWDVAPEPETLKAILSIASEAIIWGGNYFELPPSRCWLCWHKVNAVPTMSDVELAWTTRDFPAKALSLPVGKHISGHPSEKPLALISWCLKWFPKAKTVVDTYSGSGTTLVAAKLAGLQAVGIEGDEKYCEATVRRLRQNVLQFTD